MSELADNVTEAIERSHESSQGESGEAGGSNLNGLVAISVAIVATFMALCNVKDGNIGQAMEEAQASGVDAWAYYQAKGTKMNIAESARDTLVLQREIAPSMSPEARALVDKKIADYEAKIQRLREGEGGHQEVGRGLQEGIRAPQPARRPVRHGRRADVGRDRAARHHGADAQAAPHVPRVGVRGLRRGDGHRRLRRASACTPTSWPASSADGRCTTSSCRRWRRRSRRPRRRRPGLRPGDRGLAARAPRPADGGRRLADGGGAVLAEARARTGSAPTPPTTSCCPRIRRRRRPGRSCSRRGACASRCGRAWR